jgi:hypothetical protein
MLNERKAGCLVCQQDCSGGLIANVREPCVKDIPLMKPNWDVIPKPGTVVTLVVRVLPETPPAD